VIYCKFWELDTDHDFLIDKENLIRYGNHSLTYRIVDRIFTQVSLFPWCIQNLAIVYENVMLCVIILAIVLWLRYQGNSQAWQKERWVMKTSFTSYYQRKTNHLSLALNTGNCVLNRCLVRAFGELLLLSSILQFILLTCGGGAHTPFPSAGMPNIFRIFYVHVLNLHNWCLSDEPPLNFHNLDKCSKTSMMFPILKDKDSASFNLRRVLYSHTASAFNCNLCIFVLV